MNAALLRNINFNKLLTTEYMRIAMGIVCVCTYICENAIHRYSDISKVGPSGACSPLTLQP